MTYDTCMGLEVAVDLFLASTHEGTSDPLLGSSRFSLYKLLGFKGYFSRCCDRLSSMDFTTLEVKMPISECSI